MIKTYYISTYGCQMNAHESEKIAGIFSTLGMVKAQAINAADYILFNTCCVRETAETKVYGHLGMVKKIKEQQPHVKIILCGCMGQKPGGAEVLRKKFPFIDLIIGTHNIYKLADYISQIEHKRITEIVDSGEFLDTPALREDNFKASVNIMRGCNNFCSYCIVPYVRGREKSRDLNSIYLEVQGLVNNGYKEITLLGQNVNSYGNDFYKNDINLDGKDLCENDINLDGKDLCENDINLESKDLCKNDIILDGKDSIKNKGKNNFCKSESANNKKINFAYLLEKLCEIKGDFWIKFMTSHPKDFTEDIVKVILKNDKLKKFIHLPVQAGNDRVLAAMNRSYTRLDYLNKVNLIKKHIPNAGISSDIMVGFPGESELEFNDTLSLVKEVKFNNLYTFIYNKREGTPAAMMDCQISREEKVARVEGLIDLQFKIACSNAEQCVGKTYTVLCEKVVNGRGFGKNIFDQLVAFDVLSKQDLQGKFLKVKINTCKNSNLFGTMLLENL